MEAPEAKNKGKQVKSKLSFPQEVTMGDIKVQLPALANAKLMDPNAQQQQEEPKEPSTFASLLGILLCLTSKSKVTSRGNNKQFFDITIL